MNHDFLIRPAQLNQAFEFNSSSGGGGDGNDLTRRSFIKRTGGATVATMVAWNLQVANAAGTTETWDISTYTITFDNKKIN